MGTVVKALIWKNLILRWNHWFQTLREILVPLLLVLLVNLFLPPIPKVPHTREATELVCPGVSHANDKLIYDPLSNFTQDLMKRLGKKCGYKKSNIVPGDLTNRSDIFNAGFEFWNGSELNYVLFPFDGTFPTSWPIWYDSFIVSSGPRAIQELAKMQNSLEAEYVTGKLLESPPKLIGLSMDLFNSDTDLYAIFIVMAIFFSYSFLVSPVITRVVEEKESGAKELMRMMGVKSWQLWFSRLLDPLMIVILVATGIVMLLFIPLRETSNVVVSVNPFQFWIVYVMGMLSVIVSLFFISCWFDSPIIAGSVAQLVGMSSVIILGLTQISTTAWWKRLLYCLLPHMTLIYSTQTLLNFEYYGKDVNWNERLSIDGSSLTLREIFLMMILDIVLYGVLTWYVDNIRPGKFGVPRNWLFFLRCFSHQGEVSPDTTPLKQSPSGKSGISIHQLRKVYQPFGRPPVVAVDCVNLEAQEGRITALLGHNGAGKTTTMHIITGLIPATSGTVLINGHDIKLDPDSARSSLGLCPQQDLLFPDLTSLQTLVFFGMIKGLSRADAQKEGLWLLDIMKMTGSRDKETRNLSGGMKRKLSLGVAIIGGSKVLILDEPTAGVDPELRREICDLLLSFRGSRTILLTTHIMEEADAISDYINIMDHGLIKCSGTPMDLKSKFGTGYTLQVVIKENDEGVIDVVKTHVKDSRFKGRNATTLVFQLPSTETLSFPELFLRLDTMQLENAIVSYSLSISTLEDVFIRVREMEKEKKMADETDGISDCSTSKILNITNHTGTLLVLRQFWALMVKKWLVFMRSCFQFLFFACIPLLLILLSNWIIPQMEKISKNTDGGKLSSFNYTKVMYPSMEIMISLPDSCAKCHDWETGFKKVAGDRGFLVTNVLNVTKAAYDLFQQDFHQYSRRLALGLELNSDSITIQYNTHATHILPVAVNLINNALLHNTEYRISSSSNFSQITSVLPYQPGNDNGATQSSSLPDTIGFQTLFYMSALHFEKLHGSKDLIIMATGSILYWASHLIFDFITFAVYAGLMSAIYYFFEPKDPMFTDTGCYICAVLLWGVGMILISYLITLFTKTRSNAISLALLVYYVFTFFLWAFIDKLLVPSWVAYLHPSTIWKLASQQKDDLFLINLVLYSVVLFSIIILIDSKHLERIFHAIVSVVRPADFSAIGEKDSDVADVEKMVSGLLLEQTTALAAEKLCRSYGVLRPKAAVRGVSFYVRQGQCFGLIGVNGAGKTTTFNMLTAQIARSQGDASIGSSHLSSWFLGDYVSRFSFCPQSSGIIPLLEGQEYLRLFARLRGFPEDKVPIIVNYWIKNMDLEESVGKQCGRYSGGTERKLVAAAAFLWEAAVVMLDEPTAGVDPVARRCIWKAIATTQQSGNSLILTSHSMEECEALCSTVAIMVNGTFRCIGETTNLKKKFGDGYSVQLKISASSDDERTEFQNAVAESLGPGCRLTDRHCSILHYHVQDTQDVKTNWRTLFSNLEQLKAQFTIFESYIASETSLEEIFLSFAAHRRPPSGVHCVDIS